MPSLGDNKTTTRFAWLPIRIGPCTRKHFSKVWLKKVEHVYIWVTYPYGRWLHIGTNQVIKDDAK